MGCSFLYSVVYSNQSKSAYPSPSSPWANKPSILPVNPPITSVDKVLAVSTHTWVGMKARKHRVAIALSQDVQRRYNSDRCNKYFSHSEMMMYSLLNDDSIDGNQSTFVLHSSFFILHFRREWFVRFLPTPLFLFYLQKEIGRRELAEQSLHCSDLR